MLNIKKNVIEILISIFFISISISLNAQTVGSDGSLNYNVGIDVPPGTVGMAPKLALAYNSNSPNGILGVGWNLVGIPSITRDTSYPINYNGTDHYISPSGRLVLINSTSKIYHAEEESFSKFEAIGSQGDGPQYWIETKPDGTKYYYGCTDDSFITAVDQAPSARVWTLSKVVDVHGNYFTIEYYQNNGEYYPKKIIYTQGNGLSSYRQVEFIYDENNRIDKWQNNSFHSQVITNWRLKEITVKVDVVRFLGITLWSNLVRKYQLEYDSSPLAFFSRIIQINQLGYNGNIYKTFNFGWTSPGDESYSNVYASSNGIAGNNISAPSTDPFKYKIIKLDYNGDGKMDVAYYGTNVVVLGGAQRLMTVCKAIKSNGDGTFSTNETNSVITGYFVAALSFDYNGDGKSDLFTYAPAVQVARCSVMRSNGDGSFTNMYSGSTGIAGYTLSSSADSVFALDYNGDGRDDLFLYRPGTGVCCVAKSNGDGTFTSAYSSSNGIAGFNLGNASDKVFVFDYNGDGLSDLFLYRPGTGVCCVAKSNGDGTFTSVYSSSNGIAGFNLGNASDRVFAFDYNGDGISDLFLYRPGSGLCCIVRSNGDDTFESVYSDSNGIAGYNLNNTSDQVFPLDYNGDGLSDLFLYRPGSGLCCIAKSSGDGTFTSVYYSSSGIAGFNLASAYDSVFGFDYNGNRCQDLFFYRACAGACFVGRSNKNDFRYINSISTGTGKIIKIDYKYAAEVTGAIVPSSSQYPAISNSFPVSVKLTPS